MELKITPSGQTIVKPTALGPVANTDSKLLIYGLFQKGRVLAQDGINKNRKRHGFEKRSLGWQTSDAETVRAAKLFTECATALSLTPAEATDLAQSFSLSRSVGLPPYVLSNLSGTIARTRARLPAARER